MTWLDFRILLGVATIAFAFVSSIIVIRKKGLAMLFLRVWLGVTLLTELLAAYWNFRYHHNLFIYSVMGPVILLFSALYFNYSNPNLRKWNAGWFVGAMGIVFTLLNAAYFQPLNSLNSNFASFQCICMCALAVSYLYSLYSGDKILNFIENPHFWIAALFFIFYAGTFLIRSGIEVLRNAPDHRAYSSDLYFLVFILVVFFYTGVGIVIIKFKNEK